MTETATRTLAGDCRLAWHILHQADGGGPVWTLTQEVPDWIKATSLDWSE